MKSACGLYVRTGRSPECSVCVLLIEIVFCLVIIDEADIGGFYFAEGDLGRILYGSAVPVLALEIGAKIRRFEDETVPGVDLIARDPD